MKECSNKIEQILNCYSSYSRGSWKTSARRDEENKHKREEEEERHKKQREKDKSRREASSSSSSSDSEPEESNNTAPGAAEAVQEEERPTVLTEAELNALAAKLVKAELLGNEDQVAALKGRLEAARAVRAAHVAAGGDPDTQTQVR